MKRTLWQIVLSSSLSIFAYIALYSFWGAVLNSVDILMLKFLLISLFTTSFFSFFLLYLAKMRNSIGEDEVLSDYKDRPYTSLSEDLKLIFNRESDYLMGIGLIVSACFLLNTFDRVVFTQKMISFPTFFFLPMYSLDLFFENSYLGYMLSAVLDFSLYLLFLLLYRKKRYRYWMKKTDK